MSARQRASASAARVLARDVRGAVRRVARAAEPNGLTELRRACAFGRSHGTALRRWPAARAAGLDAVPAGVDLRRGLLVDVGANVGEWTAAVRRALPAAKVVAFEPAPGPARTLAARFAGDPKVDVITCAVSDRAGTSVLHVTGHDHNSSLRRPRPDTGALYEAKRGWTVMEEIEVRTVTLDEELAGEEVTVLKIDVQGAERAVLRGASDVLRATRVLLIEVTFVSHYDGDATFPSLHDELSRLGFRLNALSDPFRAHRGTGEMLWADACYSRSG